MVWPAGCLLGVTTNGRSIRIGCVGHGVEQCVVVGVGKVQLGVERFTLANRGTNVDACVVDQLDQFVA